MRLLPSDNDLSLRGETLKQAIEMDKDEGLIPFYVRTLVVVTIVILIVIKHL